MARDHVKLMDILSNSEEYDIFATDAMQNYIEFKWMKVGRSHHAFGALLHIVYLVYLAWYVNRTYIRAGLQKAGGGYITHNEPALVFAAAIVYPVVYELIQVVQIGFIDYITDFQNIQTITFVVTGLLNALIHYYESPYHFEAKLVMTLNLMMSLARTLEMLRILATFSPIVTMMAGVLREFKDFIFFFFLLVFFFSMGISILQLNNELASDAYKDDIIAAGGHGYPGAEYQYLKGYIRSFFMMFRVSTGDTNILGSVNYLPSPYNELFWAYWSFSIVICFIIFLNFVIAKACFTYDTISERLDEFILRDRANMIAEADSMQPSSMKNMSNYPKYFVVR